VYYEQSPPPCRFIFVSDENLVLIFACVLGRYSSTATRVPLVMHFRITTVLFCAVLVGFATASQNSADKSFSEINIDDDDLEGSGGGTEVSRDLESSGSGQGPPDDEDSPDDNIDVSKGISTTISNGISTNTKPPPNNNPDTSVTHVVMNPKSEDRQTFFAQPGILAAVTGGVVVGLVCAILVVMFIVYRMRKKDEGSYALDEPKRSPTANSYNRGNNKEFYA